MLTGVSTSIAVSSGMRSTAIATNASAAMPAAARACRSGFATFTAIATSSPAAAAASPANRCCTRGSFCVFAYSTPSATTTSVGPAISPRMAANAPATPRKRMPTATDRLITLPPGRNWHSPSRSVNSSAESHLRSSTMVRRANGSAPPNDMRPSDRKPVNNSARPMRRGDAAGGGAAGGKADCMGLLIKR
ncbi:hypothetical protein CSX04_00624 [Burkholderia cepacia]|nr:hypothetical protein CSX04_00624 [Burkholderia cepacia]